jgi:hypothetical protein
MVTLSAAIGVTLDDLLRGEDPEIFRIGRLTDDPGRGLKHVTTLLAR